MDKHKFTTADEFVDSFSGETKLRLETIRAIAKDMVPDCEERISYNIPGILKGKKIVIYYAGYEKHTSIYPGRVLSEEYNKLAAKYASGKSTLKFPNDEPLPLDLIKEFIALRLKDIA